MRNLDLVHGRQAIEALYGGVKGNDKLIMRRFVENCEKSSKAYSEEKLRLIKSSGSVKKTSDRIEMIPPNASDKKAVTKYNDTIQTLYEMDEADCGIEIPKRWTLEELCDVDVTNPQIDILLAIGLAYDPEMEDDQEGEGEE